MHPKAPPKPLLLLRSSAHKRWLVGALVLLAHAWFLQSDVWSPRGGSSSSAVAAMLLSPIAPEAATGSKPSNATPIPAQPPRAARTTHKAPEHANPDAKATVMTSVPSTQPAPSPAIEANAAPQLETPVRVAAADKVVAPPVTSSPAPAPHQDTPLAHHKIGVLPPSMQLSMALTGQIKGLGYSGDSSIVWRNEGEHYSMRMEAKVFLLGTLLTQTSQGQIGATGLAPERFSDKRLRGSERAAHFEYAKRRVTFSANTPQAELQIGAQDRLSVLMQLSALAGQHPQLFQAGQKLALQVIYETAAEDWVFTVVGPESLSTEQGPLETIKLSRPPLNPYDSQVELWLAPSMGHWPVRLRLSQANGDFIDQVLRKALPGA